MAVQEVQPIAPHRTEAFDALVGADSAGDARAAQTTTKMSSHADDSAQPADKPTAAHAQFLDSFIGLAIRTKPSLQLEEVRNVP